MRYTHDAPLRFRATALMGLSFWILDFTHFPPNDRLRRLPFGSVTTIRNPVCDAPQRVADVGEKSVKNGPTIMAIGSSKSTPGFTAAEAAISTRNQPTTPTIPTHKLKLKR